MPYCAKCGNQLNDGVKFCPKCGTASNPIAASFDNSAQSSEDDRRFNKAETLKEVDRMIEYFSKKSAVYNELAKSKENPNNISSDQIKVDAPQGTKFTVWGIVLLALAGTCFMVPILAIAAFTEEEIILGIILLLLWITAVFLGVLFVVKGSKRNKQRSLLIEEQKSALIKEREARLKSLETQLKTYYEKYGECKIGFNDTDPKVLKQIRMLIDTDKAVTIEDAVSLYHRSPTAPAVSIPAAPITPSASSSPKKALSTRAGWRNAEIYTIKYVDPQVVKSYVMNMAVLSKGVKCQPSQDGRIFTFGTSNWQARLARIAEDGYRCEYRFEFTHNTLRKGIPVDAIGLKNMLVGVEKLFMDLDPGMVIRTEEANVDISRKIPII